MLLLPELERCAIRILESHPLYNIDEVVEILESELKYTELKEENDRLVDKLDSLG
jgi:hypothetical protein